MQIKVGDKFGNWEVIGLPDPSPKTGEPRATDKATCLCQRCGSIHDVSISNLCAGKTRNCSKCANRVSATSRQGISYGRVITHNGESHTITEWSRKSGIPRNTIVLRLTWQWDPGDAVSTPVYDGVTVNGETRTVTDWAKHTGISRECIRQRVKKGWSLEDAVSTPGRITGRPKSR